MMYANRISPSATPSAASRCAGAAARLEREHLVTVQPRRYRVNPISLSDARDLLRFRQALEPACVAEAIENADAVLALDEFRLFAGDQWVPSLRLRLPFGAGAPPATPGMAAALCDLIGQADRRWSTSASPASGGTTPRNWSRSVTDRCDAAPR